jgi:transposase InsO family protein
MRSKFDIIHSDVRGPLHIQWLRRTKDFVTFIDTFSQYTWICLIRQNLDVKTVFWIVYNLVEIQFFAKIKKLKTDNGGEYVNKEMTAFLETKGIIYDLSPPYAHESNSLAEWMNCTIVTKVQSMT